MNNIKIEPQIEKYTIIEILREPTTTIVKNDDIAIAYIFDNKNSEYKVLAYKTKIMPYAKITQTFISDQLSLENKKFNRLCFKIDYKNRSFGLKTRELLSNVIFIKYFIIFIILYGILARIFQWPEFALFLLSTVFIYAFVFAMPFNNEFYSALNNEYKEYVQYMQEKLKCLI